MTIAVILVLTGVYDHSAIERKFRKLKDDIEKYKLDNDEVINRLNKMKESASLLQNEYKDTDKKYGTWEEKFDLVEERFTYETTNNRKKYIKK